MTLSGLQEKDLQGVDLLFNGDRLLDLDIAGVDLLFNGDSYTICEVNSVKHYHCQFYNLLKVWKNIPRQNIAEKMVDYIIKKWEVNSYYYKRTETMKRYFIIFLTFFTNYSMDWFGIKLFKGYREYYMETLLIVLKTIESDYN